MNGSEHNGAVTVLLGGLSAVFFGIGDLLGGMGVRKSGRSGAAVGMSIVATAAGALVIGVYLLFSPPSRWLAPTSAGRF